MIASSHFTRIADRQDVDAKTVERDYVLTHVLAAIARQTNVDRIVFKGGTALRLCYFAEYRYSADLDFSLREGAELQKVLDAVQAALQELGEQVGFPHLTLSPDGRRVEYVGPLGKQREIKLDIATDELIEQSTMRPLLDRYPDQPEVQVDVYTLNEIAAEKLRCVIQRLQARDLFDLHELLVINRIDVADIWPAFQRKARHKQIDPGRFAEMFEKRLPHWRDRWQDEMSEHLPGEPQQFNAIERAVRRALRSKLRDD